MITQSYTSFLNNVHQKANIHIFVIKVNESTGQRVNESTSRNLENSKIRNLEESKIYPQISNF